MCFSLSLDSSDQLSIWSTKPYTPRLSSDYHQGSNTQLKAFLRVKTRIHVGLLTSRESPENERSIQTIFGD